MAKKKKIPSDVYAFMRELIDESLRDWFKKEDWVRITTAGNIAGPCGTSKNKKNPDRCLPRAKAQSLTKAERAATARKKKKAGAQGKTVVKNTKKAKVTREGKFDDMTKFDLVKKNPFDIKKLVDKGIIHVTAPGDGEGGIGKPNWEGDASIITLYNLSKAEPWMKKAITMPAPKAIPHVQDNQEGLFYNGKYNQILWSIEKKGFKPEEFYLRTKITREMKEQWPKEVPSRHGDIIFKLIKVMPDRAKYALIDAETGKEWEIGGRVYGNPDRLKADAENTIMPQGGRQSSHFGTRESANPQDGKAAPYGSGYGKITKEDIKNLVVGLIYEAQGKEVLTEKDDRCTRIAKRKYDTWPSAYASGAVVRCRRGEIWKKEK